MTNCWLTLGIPATQDIDEIHRVRRALIRIWHPDTVADAQQKEDFTRRCAAINVAHDEAVCIAQRTARVLAADFQPWTFDPESVRSARRHRFSTDFAFTLFSPRAGLFAIIYMLSFRYTLPLTIAGVIFTAGLVLAACTKTLLYRHVARFKGDSLFTWAVLQLANVLVAYYLLGAEAHPLFQAGVLFAIPLWRLRHWMKERPLHATSAS